MRSSLVALLMLSVVALLVTGCVVSETEKGPGPGDQKKSQAPSTESTAADPKPGTAPTPAK